MENQKFSAEEARQYKKYVSKTHLSEDQYLEEVGIDDSKLKRYEQKQKVEDIKKQISYFGYEIEPFNMKSERDMGDFDNGGYFVFNKQKDKSIKYSLYDLSDAWLDQLDQQNVFKELQEKAMNEDAKKIKKEIKYQNKVHGNQNGAQFFKSNRYTCKEEAAQKYELDQQQSSDEDNDKIQQEEVEADKNKQQEPDLYSLGVDQLKEILSELLEPGETPTKALKRLKTQLPKKQPYKKNQRQKVNSEIIQEQSEEHKQALNLIVDLCTVLLTKLNDPDIYNTTKEQLKPDDTDNIF